METKKLSKRLTDNRFGGWGWSMIFYTMIYIIGAGLIMLIPYKKCK